MLRKIVSKVIWVLVGVISQAQSKVINSCGRTVRKKNIPYYERHKKEMDDMAEYNLLYDVDKTLALLKEMRLTNNYNTTLKLRDEYIRLRDSNKYMKYLIEKLADEEDEENQENILDFLIHYVIG